jgi:hypothetical protein
MAMTATLFAPNDYYRLDEAFVIPFSESYGTSGIDVARRSVRNITSDAWGLYNYQDIALDA